MSTVKPSRLLGPTMTHFGTRVRHLCSSLVEKRFWAKRHFFLFASLSPFPQETPDSQTFRRPRMWSTFTSHQLKHTTEKMGCLPHPDNKLTAQMLEANKQTNEKRTKTKLVDVWIISNRSDVSNPYLVIHNRKSCLLCTANPAHREKK